MRKKFWKRKLKRKCLICGQLFSLTVYADGHYNKGHYFGRLKLPIEGTGEYKKTGFTCIGKQKIAIVKWTGKEKELEYWECNNCFEKAMHECWLEEKIENLFGKRCKDFVAECATCSAWSLLDIIKESDTG